MCDPRTNLSFVHYIYFKIIIIVMFITSFYISILLIFINVVTEVLSNQNLLFVNFCKLLLSH